MFQRIKKVFGREGRPPADAPVTQSSQSPVSEWASSRGFELSTLGHGDLSLQGTVAGRPWRMEIGRPSRKFIAGEELRARAELGLSDDMAVMIMNRPLKDALEKHAYSIITDTLQTTIDPNLPEEMRWLAMYDEVGWEGLPDPFWERYAVLADRREAAPQWIDFRLAELLLDWPEPVPDDQVPFMMMLLRGKAYLRMQYEPAELTTLDHAARIFDASCASALRSFGNA